MNVAYLLVSTAWLAGDTTPAKTYAAPLMVQPAPAIGTSIGGNAGCDSGCGGSCDTGCCDSSGGWGHRFKQRMSGLFRKSHSSCCDTCAPAPTCCSAPAPAPACCGATTTASCDSCCESSSWSQKLRGRMKGLFHKHRSSGCCDTGCGDCGTGCNSCGGAPAPAISYGPGGMGMPGVKGAEQIPAPRDGTPAKMPDGKDNAPPAKGVQINVVPNAPVPAVAPTLESAPTVAPVPAPTDADNREQRTPF